MVINPVFEILPLGRVTENTQKIKALDIFLFEAFFFTFE